MTAVPPPPRKTLLEWIDTDDGDTPDSTLPDCSKAVRSLHTLAAFPPAASDPFEPLASPAGLALAPLG